MKRIFIVTSVILLLVSQAGTVWSESFLFEIVNNIVKQSLFTNNADMMSSDRYLPDGSDAKWTSTGDSQVSVTVRYAGYGQELGINDNSGSQTIVDSGDIPNKKYVQQDAAFSPDGEFSFVDNVSSGDTWSSDNSENSGGQKDHFKAIDVSDLYPDVDSSFIIAFEDLNLGDADYNDLVAMVNGVAPTPVPEPATIFLIGSGLIGLAGLRRKTQNS